MIITGLGASWRNKLRSIGIRSYEFLPHGHYLDLVKASDVYFLPATISYYYGGTGVSVMEALALGKPIVSPTLIHFPEKNKIKDIGAITSFVYNETSLKIFIKRLTYVIENIDSYKAELISKIAYRYYSWESFIKTFEETVRKI